MSRNVVTKSNVPPAPYECALVCIPIAAVPFTLGALALKSQKYWYASLADWHRGRKLLAHLGKELLMPCGVDIVNAIDRVYNLLDSGLNGTGRSATGTGTAMDPYIYSPPLQQTSEPDDYAPPSLRSDANVTRYLLDNLVTGSPNAVASDNRNFRQQLDDIKLALEAGEDLDPEMLAKLGEIALLLA